MAVLVTACGATAGGPNPIGDTRAEQDRLVLTIATGESNPEEATAFALNVADVSDGSIEVKVDNASITGVPDYETRVINHVAEGKAQLGFVAARAFDTVGVTGFVGLHAPFLIDSYELEAQVLASKWGQALLDGTRPAGVVGISYLQGPFRRPLGLTRELADPDDFKGAKIGIRASALIEMTMKALGATPVVFAPGDTDGLDGMEVHMGQIHAAKYDVGAESLTGNVIFWGRPGVVFANEAAFDSLNADQRAILREAGQKTFDASVRSVSANGAGLPDVLCGRGLLISTASEAGVAALRTAVQPVYDEIEKDAGTKATIDAIEALRASVDASSDDVECTIAAATPDPTPVAVDSPILGTWTTSFTLEELAASPLLYDPGEANNENWGVFTITFGADGHVSLTLENPTASSSTTGTFTIDGDHVVLAYDEGANLGETFGARWSIFRDTLTIERARDEELPTPYILKTWARVP
jgi:TRAP-type C4-dicarboxylate transport system substrate-binding protein